MSGSGVGAGGCDALTGRRPRRAHGRRPAERAARPRHGWSRVVAAAAVAGWIESGGGGWKEWSG